MDDFFSSAPVAGTNNALTHPTPATDPEELSNFEAAIGKRFGGTSPSSLLTTRMMAVASSSAASPMQLSLASPPSLSSSSTASKPASRADANTPRLSMPSIKLSMPMAMPSPSVASSGSPFLVSTGHFPRTPMPVPQDSASGLNVPPRLDPLALSPPAPSRTPSGPLSQLSLQSSPSAKPRQSGSGASGSSSSTVKGDATSKYVAHLPSDLPAVLQSGASSSLSSSSSTPPQSLPTPASAKSASSSDNGFSLRLPPRAFRMSSPAPPPTTDKEPTALIIDIRNHHHFVASRIKTSINLSVPSTLLKRPAFSLSKLADMIPLPSDRIAFSSWNRDTVSRIIVYDTDTGVLSAGNNVLGLLNKFHNEGFRGELGYVVGGFNAVIRTQQGVVSDAPLEAPPASDEGNGIGSLGSHQLPSSAFQQGSTGKVSNTKVGTSPSLLIRRNQAVTDANSPFLSLPSLSSADLTHNRAGDNYDGQKTPTISSSTTRSVVRIYQPNRVAVANPFYDNIRQNLELSTGITERIPLVVPPYILKRETELPFQWLRDIVRKAAAKSADGIIGGEALEDLAMQFYRIELGEQRRLNGVMEHHSHESTIASTSTSTSTPAAPLPPPSRMTKTKGSSDARTSASEDRANADKGETKPAAFPYSITAGVEKGAKNRYRNIWPFEHARVRLQHPTDDDGTGYINASYVQPRGTALKYIATQGPLAATFTDFWTLVWEQNVSILVMLTRQIEGHSIKCHCYWKGERFGPLRLQCTDVQGPVHLEKDILGDDPNAGGVGNGAGSNMTGFDFAVASATASNDGDFSASTNADHSSGEDEDTIIRRTFLLSHDDHPEVPPRKIVQLQFLGWPDLNVPSSSRALLKLVQELDELRAEFRSMGGSRAINPTASEHRGRVQPGPVLVHCSAGVGRTGSFVIIDAVLDAIRRETRKKLTGPGPVRPSLAKDGGKGDWRRRKSSGETDVTDEKPAPSTSEESATSPMRMLDVSSLQLPSEESSAERPKIVKLDSHGNEVNEPDGRTVKKRKSSLADASNLMGSTSKSRGGSIDGLADMGLHARGSPPPPVPPMPSTNLTYAPATTTEDVSARQPSLESRNLQGLRSQRGPSVESSIGTSSQTGTPSTNKSPESATEGWSMAESGDTSMTSRTDGSISASRSVSASAWASTSPAAMSSLDVRLEKNSGNDSLWKGKKAQDLGDSVRPLSLSSVPSSMPLALPDFAKKKLAARSSSNVATAGNSAAPSPPDPASRIGSPAVTRPGSSMLKMSLKDSTMSPPASLDPPPTVPADLPAPWTSNVPSSQQDASSTFASSDVHPRFTSPLPSGNAPKAQDSHPESSTGDQQGYEHDHPPSHLEPNPSAAYDYAPPRRIWLNKQVKRGAKAAAERAATATNNSASTSFAPSPLRAAAVASPSPLSTSITASHDMVIDAAPSDVSRATEKALEAAESSGDDNDNPGRSSSEELSPSSPESLNDIDEPIRQVLEDMREQRMSLCQTLRQYVFVHLAILEGSLEIVDQLNLEQPATKQSSVLPSPPPIEHHTRGRPSLDLSRADHFAYGSSSSAIVEDDMAATSSDRTRIASSFSAKRLSVKRKKRSNESNSPQYEKMVID